MATPTDEQLAARGLSREQYNQRNELWHALLAKKPPEERARINENTGGIEGLLLAGQVEMALAEHKKKTDHFSEWHKPFEVEQPREDLEAPPFIMQSEGAIDPAKLAPENEQRAREYRERTARVRPKFREIMIHGSSESWSLRFWFGCKVVMSSEVSDRRIQCHSIVRDIMVEIVTECPATIIGVEIICERILKAEHDCAALEILNGDTANGDVLYFDWP